jgi:anti-sigma factor RsiW
MTVMDGLSCAELVELVTDYLDGALDRRSRRQLEAHLAECDGCDAYLDQIRATIALSGRLRPDGLAPDAREALLGVFRKWRQLSPAP